MTATQLMLPSLVKRAAAFVAHRASQRQSSSAVGWIGEGLSFRCTACGRCCTGGADRTVSVNAREAEAIAASLGLTEQQFQKAYVQDALQQSGQQILRKNADGTACVFLGTDGRSCQVYANRPIQCRTYPWWPEALTSKHDWEAEALRCEGIQLAPPPSGQRSLPIATDDNTASFRHVVADQEQPRNTHRAEQATVTANDAVLSASTDAAPATAAVQQLGGDAHVPAREICKQLALEEIRRSGEMGACSYEDLEELLDEVSPELVDELAEDFFTSNSREVLYESSTGVKVLDSSIGVPLQRSRSLVFSCSPGHVQTEVALRSTPEGLQPDHSQLMLPAHRGMCYAFAILQLIRPDRQQLSLDLHLAPQPQPALRTLILGAGGCALAMSLRHHFPSMTVDAVELQAEVLEVARRYFGACEDGRMKFHAADAVQFVRGLTADTKYDVILVDAAVTDPADPSEVLAPPPSFLQPDFVEQGLCAHLSENGVLAVNAVGGMSSVLRALHHLRPHFSQCRAYRMPEQSLLFGSSPAAAAAVGAEASAGRDAQVHRWDISASQLAAALSKSKALGGLCQDLLMLPLTRWQLDKATQQELKLMHGCGWYATNELDRLLNVAPL